ncbi:hypothetical protein ACTXM3_18655 [Glutamicibacter arilaitensis]|uniref:Uncharacterized protein n=1 Tax=Glutamicibacter arilaitensis TaxID=256701 RepID=A0A2N7S1H0_9MICC|nr:hypothetical protein [Glutamicibacter arilaitensis]PMQ19990.1 hypothetical protein CIK84_15350 [Glutamicibacter arilaitensis]
MKRNYRLTAILAVSAVFLSGTVANADENSVKIDDLLTSAPGHSRVLTSTSSAPANGTISLPSEDAGQIKLKHPDGTWLTVGLPQNADISSPSDQLSRSAGAAVITEPMQSSTSTQGPDANASLSARAVVAVPDANADRSYNFDLGYSDGIVPQLDKDGSVQFVLDPQLGNSRPGVEAEASFGEIKTPWAIDANGKKVPTKFTLKGNTLTQTINPTKDTTYPVILDPEAEWKGFYGRLTYSRAETKNMRDEGVVIAGLLTGSAGIAAMFGPGAPVVGAALAAASAAAVGIISATASNASADGRCLQIDIPPLVNPRIVNCRS